MKTPIVVMIEKAGAGLNHWQYTRIADRKVTDIVQSDDALDNIELEAFRVNPEKALSEAAA